MTQNELAHELILKHPTLSQTQLAKILYKENMAKFKSADSARTVIRVVLGKTGSKKKKYASIDANSLKSRYNKESGGYALPEEQYEEWTPYVIPKNIKNILVISDLQIPFQDNKALSLAIKYGKENNVDGIILNGDIMDLFSASTFERDPRKHPIWEELEATRKFIKHLRHHFPTQYILWKEGNHEYRIKRFLYQKAPELLGIPDFELPVLLKFGENKIHWVDKKRVIKAGKASLLHGHEFMSRPSQSVNPARGVMLRTYHSCIISDVHKTSEHTETTLDGEVLKTWSIGCLCYLHPDFAVINRWNQGFGHLVIQKDGDYNFYNKSIQKGKNIMKDAGEIIITIAKIYSEEDVLEGLLDLIHKYKNEPTKETQEELSLMLSVSLVKFTDGLTEDLYIKEREYCEVGEKILNNLN